MRRRTTPPRSLHQTRRRDRTRGQGLVEFALILPVFLVLLSAAIDLGRLAYARIAVENAAREGAFQAAETPTSYTAGQPCPAIDPITGQPPSNLVICRTLLEAAGSVISVSPSDVSVNCSPSCTEGLGNTVSVTVNGHFKLLTPFMALFFGGYTINFASTSTMQIETLPDVADPSVAPSVAPSVDPSVAPSADPSVAPTIDPTCYTPSAGFTHTDSPVGMKSPVTMTVVDTSSASPSCPITKWTWHWGDGGPDYIGRTPPPHVFYNPGPPENKSFSITLTVQTCPLASCTSTSGAAVITVKK
jgi:Flp pilus assembly protein TadG